MGVVDELRAEAEKRAALEGMERDSGHPGWRLRAEEHRRVADLCRRAVTALEAGADILELYGERRG